MYELCNENITLWTNRKKELKKEFESGKLTDNEYKIKLEESNNKLNTYKQKEECKRSIWSKIKSSINRNAIHLYGFFEPKESKVIVIFKM